MMRAASARASKGAGLMVIELGNGRRIRVDRDFDTDALGRVLDILDRRR
jgi:transposase